MKRVLVTGAGGFVGQSISGLLERAGYEACGVDRGEVAEACSDRKLLSCDLGKRSAVNKLLKDVEPDCIVHLAAQSSAGRSFREPLKTIKDNVLPALHILEFLRSEKSDARLLAVGSADTYGPVEKDELPLRETRPPNPVSPYALSKVMQEECCAHYATLFRVNVVLTRSFNHTGGGQRDDFVLSSFAKQVVEVKKGLREPLVEVGNVDVRRDFLDVRDVGRAYIALLEEGAEGEIYNVCSGVSYSLRELLGKLCQLADVELEVRVRKDRLRPADIEELLGDNHKILQETGWRPRIPIEDTLKSLLDYWGEQLES